jgi:hypothetical protein
MLDDRDRRRCREIEDRLAADDPAFAARMRASARPRPLPAAVAAGVTLYVTTLSLGLIGGWPLAMIWAVVFLIAVVVALRRRRR